MWVLIILIFSGGSTSSLQVNFKNESACKKAADEIGHVEGDLNGHLARVDTFCYDTRDK